MLPRKKSKRYNFHGRARYVGKRLTKSCGYNIKKSESLEKSIFENKIEEDKNNAGEFDEDLNDIGDGYAVENDNEMERHSDLSESENSSENSEEDYAIMLDEMPERDEFLERSDDEEEKIECGDEMEQHLKI